MSGYVRPPLGQRSPSMVVLGPTSGVEVRHLACLAAMTSVVAIVATMSLDPAAARPIRGTDGPDVLVGTRHSDRIDARAGDDTVRSGRGSDVALGGAGDDVMKLGPGGGMTPSGQFFDQAYGGTGADKIFGGAGPDAIYDEGGNDVLRGSSGNDALTDGLGRDSIYGGTGDDRVNLGRGRNVVYMGRGDDEVFASGAVGQADVIDCGPGNDTLNYDHHRDHADVVTGCEGIFVINRTARNPNQD